MDQVNINHRLKKRIEVIEKFRELCIEEISEISSTLISVFSNGNKLLICGNGGSAADSQHLAAEFVSSFARGLRRRSLPAISLTVDTSIITAISNDFGYERVFSRQIEGLASEGDAVLLISTSGKSKSCLNALETSKERGVQTLALTSKDSELYRLADRAIGVPSNDTQLIQECHMVAYHLIAELVDDFFAEKGQQ